MLRRITLRYFCIVVLSAISLSSTAKNLPTDTIVTIDSYTTNNDSIQYQTKPKYRIETDYNFNYKQLILPVALTAVGWWGVSNGFIREIDNEVASGMESLRGDNYTHVDDYLQYLPIVGYLGLGSIGVKGQISFKERLMVGLTAYASTALLTKSIKLTVDEARPDGSDENSFPSGHTAIAFMGAELIRIEYGTWPAVGAYTVASTVAFLRLYNNQHWLNDVVAGAGIGILSARIGYWLLPVWRKLFKWDKSDKYITIAPSYNPTTNTCGIGAVVLF